MAKTNYDSIEEKQNLQARALMLKPTVTGVIATDRGWAIPQSRGTMELLVSFGGLDQLLGDEISQTEQVGEPIVVVATPEPEILTEEIVTPTNETESETTDDTPVEMEDETEPDGSVIKVPKKRGPKPKVAVTE